MATPSTDASVTPLRQLGHSKLDATALYTKVSTRTIHAVAEPLDRLMELMQDTPPPT